MVKILTVISGNLGSGKTLLLTILGKLSKKNVISNFELNFEFTIFSLADFVNSKYNHSTILIDEAYTLVESRNSMSNQNRAISYVLFQSRKKSLDMYLTVQLNSSLDIRFRQLADYNVIAEGLIKNKGKIYFKYSLITDSGQKSIYIPYKFAEHYFKLYNTNEIVDPPNKSELIKTLKTPNEKIEECKKLAKEFIDKNIKITKINVKTYLFENMQPKQYLDYVYSYAKKYESEKSNGTI